MPPKNVLSIEKIQAALDATLDKSVRRVLQDGGGITLICRPGGVGWWRMRYRWAGGENSLSLWIYPAVSMEQARQAATRIRGLIADGVDPSKARKLDRAALVAAAKPASIKPARFLVDQEGTLFVRLPGRAFTLSAQEAQDLRTFLVAVQTVGGVDRGC